MPLLPLANLDAPYVLEGVRRSDYSSLRETHIGCFILTLNGTTTTAAPISPVIATPPPPPLRAPRFCPASASWFYAPPPPPYQYYFFHSTGQSLSEEYCQKIYSAAAQAAVMEDKCRVHAGLLDPDGSVFCRICFRVEILSESPRLYLCGRLKSLRLSISAGMAQ